MGPRAGRKGLACPTGYGFGTGHLVWFDSIDLNHYIAEFRWDALTNRYRAMTLAHSFLLEAEEQALRSEVVPLVVNNVPSLAFTTNPPPSGGDAFYDVRTSNVYGTRTTSSSPTSFFTRYVGGAQNRIAVSQAYLQNLAYNPL